MNIKITGRKLSLSEETMEHIRSSLLSFNKYALDILSVDAVLSLEKKNISVELNIKVAKNNPIIISHSHHDLESAVDIAVDRAEKSLGRLHDKKVDHNKETIKALALTEEE